MWDIPYVTVSSDLAFKSKILTCDSWRITQRERAREKERRGAICRHSQHVHSGVTVLLMIQSKRPTGSQQCTSTMANVDSTHHKTLYPGMSLLFICHLVTSSHCHMSTFNYSRLVLIVMMFLYLLLWLHSHVLTTWLSEWAGQSEREIIGKLVIAWFKGLPLQNFYFVF